MRRSNYHPGEKRDNCYFCQSWDTEEHHIIPQRFGGPDTRENVVELCNHCHKKMERLYDQQFYEWFGIDDSKGERKYHRPCWEPECTNTADYMVDTPDHRIDRVICESCLRENAEEAKEEAESTALLSIDPEKFPVEHYMAKIAEDFEADQ